MGNARIKPQRLAEKLLYVRSALGLSQNEMLRRIDAEEQIAASAISTYETGKSEPPLYILLQYARVAGVHMEVFVDDELDLPEKLPATTRHKEIKRKSMSEKN